MMMQQMQDPRFQQLMSNPRALQAMMQVQQGMQSLQTEAPGLFSGTVPTPGVNTGTSSTTNPTTPSTTTTTNTSGNAQTPCMNNLCILVFGCPPPPNVYSYNANFSVKSFIYLQNYFWSFSALNEPKNIVEVKNELALLYCILMTLVLLSCYLNWTLFLIDL